MNPVIEIFNEYVRMREHGLEASETLSALRGYTQSLNSQNREELSNLLQGWESNKVSAQEVNTLHAAAAPVVTDSWIECPNCNKKNRTKEIFCYSCGNMLQDPTKHRTRNFSPATSDLYPDDYFGSDSILILEGRDDISYFELRPQLFEVDIVIGRSANEQAIHPDVDLATAGGAELGVSRLHLAMFYDLHGQCIKIHDLGSSNGTFVNGQRLHPSEKRILRHTDQLRLGHLVLNVSYHHPGTEIP